MTINFPQGIEIKYDLPLNKYCSFKTGGKADIALFPKNKEEFAKCIRELSRSNVRFEIIGNASNILFDDNGFRGVLIFTSKMNTVTYTEQGEECYMTAECGVKLTELAMRTLKHMSLSGLEFAYGIPGSVGGAVYMNAGAYGGEMSDIVIESLCYSAKDDAIITLDGKSHNFSYRHSVFQEQKDLYIISTTLRLKKDTSGAAMQKAIENMNSRKEKQPLEYPNAGSTFKRPKDAIAAKLIDDCGLKGMSSGGAQVSEKHAGFIINRDGATSSDVLTLASIVCEQVKNKYGTELELEIIYLPEK